MKKRIFFLISILLFCYLQVFSQDKTDTIISDQVINGEAISLPKPAYPGAAASIGAKGSVNVQVLIDEEGNVVSAKALTGHPLLRSASEKAAREAKFKPVLIDGKLFKVSGVITYVYGSPGSNEFYPTDKERLQIMGLGASLLIIEKQGANYNFDDENSYVKRLAKNSILIFPKFVGAFEPFQSINNTNTEKERAEAFEKVSLNVKNKLSGSEVWQFSFGQRFGSLIWNLKQNSPDETELKSIIIEIKKMLSYPFPNIPQDVLSKFHEIVNFAGSENLKPEEIRKELLLKTTEILGLISQSK